MWFSDLQRDSRCSKCRRPGANDGLTLRAPRMTIAGLRPPCEVMKIAISPAAQIFAHHVAPGCESFAHTAGHEQINSTGSWNRAHELSKDLTSFIQPETPVKRALGPTSIEPQRRRSHESQRYKSRASASYGRFLACFTLLRPKPPAGGANELDVSPRSMVNMPGDAMA